MSGDMVPYFNDASELFITRDLEIGDRYTVFAPVFEGGDTGLNTLVNAAAGTEDEYYEDFLELYIAASRTIWSRSCSTTCSTSCRTPKRRTTKR